MYFGSTCTSPAFPTLLRPPLPALQPTLDVKPFLQFSLDNTAVAGLFPNFNVSARYRTLSSDLTALISKMDPIQKAVINHTFGVALPHKRKHVITCNTCQLRFNSENQAVAHYKGTKHAKKLKALEATKNKQKCVATTDSAKTIFTSITTNTINANSDKTDGDGTEFEAEMMKVQSLHQPVTRSNWTRQVMEAAAVDVLASEVVHNEVTENATMTSAISTAATVSTVLAVKNSVLISESSTKNIKKSCISIVNSTTCTPTETEEEKAKRLLYCSLCKVAVNSSSQLEAHNTGTKHKTMLEARNGSGTIKAFPRTGIKGKLFSNKGTTGLQNKTFHCEICDVHVNSETQLKQHISSRRHKDRAAGKPPKPKYSPYNKLQRRTNSVAVKLAFRKEVPKPLCTRILSNPLAAAAALAVNSPFHLRSNPAATLFQTAGLPAALLRPAPGPIRTTHTPILFAPY
ncbi:zinc finger protein 385D isoform X2 [Protopterus annectens]|uniref:zinc finger protein 385D isoform X2 n=1 Tax=Protopterus annectens TaxID=7888 RepID=UPI001CFC2991|nr:zinc finger protein 385D isoform X2 [Protopterus annectens]